MRALTGERGSYINWGSGRASWRKQGLSRELKADSARQCRGSRMEGVLKTRENIAAFQFDRCGERQTVMQKK